MITGKRVTNKNALRRANKDQVNRIVEGIIQEATVYVMENFNCDEQTKKQYISVTEAEVRKVDFFDITTSLSYSDVITDEDILDVISKFVEGFKLSAISHGLATA